MFKRLKIKFWVVVTILEDWINIGGLMLFYTKYV